MKHTILSMTLIFLTNLLLGQELPEKISETDFSIGKTVNIKSKVLDETRELNIYCLQVIRQIVQKHTL